MAHWSPPTKPLLQTRYNPEKKADLGKRRYTCTLCWLDFEKPYHIVGSDSRIVCVNCWRWMYDLSVCWTCGEIVFRKEDAVSFGWCWWHWGYFSCLVCSAPPAPPSYLDASGKPQTGGISLHEPPLCSRCVDLSDSLLKLEQHAAVMNLSKAGGVASKPVDWMTPRVSIFKPLQMEKQAICTNTPKPLAAIRQNPSWMSLLPSNRNLHVQPPHQSALQRRSSFPYFSCTRYSSPFLTPPKSPTAQAQCSQLLSAPASHSTPQSLLTPLSRRCPSEWPSPSQSFDHSVSSSRITVEGAIVSTDMALNKSPPALTEPALSQPDAMLYKTAVPEMQALKQNQTRNSPSMLSLVSSAMMTPIKHSRSGLEDLHCQSPRPTKIRELSMADCMPDIPMRHGIKPAYFKELSDFLASRDNLLILPSRAFDRRQNLGKSLDHEGSKSTLSHALTEDVEGAPNDKADAREMPVNKSSERLNILAGKVMAMISARPDQGGAGMLCKACRDCPCTTKDLRRRLGKASG